MSKSDFFHDAAILDANDPLKEFRSLFCNPGERLVYLDGNSLGMLPSATAGYIDDIVTRRWGERLIRSYNEGWWNKPEELGARIARLTGARPDEVIVCDSVSVNMFKMIVAALREKEGRLKIVSDELNFGTDLYIIQGAADLLGKGHRLHLMKSRDGITVGDDETDGAIDNDTALVSLSHVSFRSSFMYDMPGVTSLAHERGAFILWDLCHAVGAVPIDLNGANADFAAGCTYKYLNGGPGATAFMYVRKDLQEKLSSPIWGWWADADPFSFNTGFVPAGGMRRFLAGSVPILSSSTLETSLDIFEKAGMARIRKKSLEMSGFFLELFKRHLAHIGFRLGSPNDGAHRGSHISLRHPEAYRICKALIDESEGEWTIIPDFRTPDNIRIGFAPLYNTFREIAIITSELGRIVRDKVFEKYDTEKEVVT